jgi:hypothetical protein
LGNAKSTDIHKKINGEYHVFKDLKSVKYEDAILPDEGGMIEGTRVYPI